MCLSSLHLALLTCAIFAGQVLLDLTHDWTIDPSKIGNLRKLDVHCTSPRLEVKPSCFALWQQMLKFLAHFSTAPVESVNIDIQIRRYSRGGIPDYVDRMLCALRDLPWSRLGTILRRCPTLKKACVSMLYDDEAPSIARQFLALIGKEMQLPDSQEGIQKVQLEWRHSVESGGTVQVAWDDFRNE